MSSQLFIQFEEAARVSRPRRVIEWCLKVTKNLISLRIACAGKSEIELAVLPNALAGAEKENFILYDWTTEREAVIIAAQRRRVFDVWLQRIGRVECVIAEEQRSDAVIFIVSTSRDYVDDRSRRLSKLSFVSRCQDLKLSNRLLIKLRCRAASDSVFIRLAINHEVVVACALAEDRRRIVAADICLAIDDCAGHEL